MKNTIVSLCLFITVILMGISSCKKESPVCDGSTSTYNSNIKSIINENCTNPGCHNTGSSRGDFTTYNGIKPFLDNGRFKTQVLDKQIMPKGSKKLSSDQLNKIMCWHENSYPEN